jgi:hypothetical protein
VDPERPVKATSYLDAKLDQETARSSPGTPSGLSMLASRPARRHHRQTHLQRRNDIRDNAVSTRVARGQVCRHAPPARRHTHIALGCTIMDAGFKPGDLLCTLLFRAVRSLHMHSATPASWLTASVQRSPAACLGKNLLLSTEVCSSHSVQTLVSAVQQRACTYNKFTACKPSKTANARQLGYS